MVEATEDPGRPITEIRYPLFCNAAGVTPGECEERGFDYIEGPFDDRALVTIKDVPLAHTEDETGITWEFGLPASRATGFQPKAGDAPAFNFAFETERTITHGRRFIAAFEPHRFVSFRLAE